LASENTSLYSGSLAHIYVPAGSVDAYKEADNWSRYASIIEAIPAGVQVQNVIYMEDQNNDTLDTEAINLLLPVTWKTASLLRRPTHLTQLPMRTL